MAAAPELGSTGGGRSAVSSWQNSLWFDPSWELSSARSVSHQLEGCSLSPLVVSPRLG